MAGRALYLCVPGLMLMSVEIRTLAATVRNPLLPTYLDEFHYILSSFVLLPTKRLYVILSTRRCASAPAQGELTRCENRLAAKEVGFVLAHELRARLGVHIFSLFPLADSRSLFLGHDYVECGPRNRWWRSILCFKSGILPLMHLSSWGLISCPSHQAGLTNNVDAHRNVSPCCTSEPASQHGTFTDSYLHAVVHSIHAQFSQDPTYMRYPAAHFCTEVHVKLEPWLRTGVI